MPDRAKLTAGTGKGLLFVLSMLVASLLSSPALAFDDDGEFSSFRPGFETSGLCTLPETAVETRPLDLEADEAAGANPEPGPATRAPDEVQHAPGRSGDPLILVGSFAPRERRNCNFNARAPPQPE